MNKIRVDDDKAERGSGKEGYLHNIWFCCCFGSLQMPPKFHVFQDLLHQLRL